MYVISPNFTLTTISLTEIDNRFLNISHQYLKKYPFKWNYFVEKIIKNSQIVYFKDSTGIINVNYIDFKKIETLFELFKIYLQNKIIRKIIYKKEFIIIHFNDNFHMELIRIYDLLISIDLYYYLKENLNKNDKVYFGVILSKNNIKTIIPIVVTKNGKYFLFDTNKLSDIIFDDQFIRIYLYKNEKALSLEQKDNNLIKFQITHSYNNYKDNLFKIINQQK